MILNGHFAFVMRSFCRQIASFLLSDVPAVFLLSS